MHQSSSSPKPGQARALVSFAAAFALLGPAAPLSAGNGDVLAISSVLSGKELTDVTFDSSSDPAGGSFWVVTRLDGKIYHLSSSLDSVLGEIPNPHGVGTIPNFILTWGVAYRPGASTLFVLAQGAGKWRVREARTSDGVEVAPVFEVVPPSPSDAGLRGLTFEAETQRLWFLDAQTETVFSADLTGAVLAQFPVPFGGAGGGVLRGEGLCLELERVSPTEIEPRLYVAYGDAFRKYATRAIQLTLSGDPTGVEVPFTSLPFAARGIQTQTLGLQRRMVVTSSDGRIGLLEQRIPAPVPPSQLVCSLTRSNKVELTWRNNGAGGGAYGGTIRVLRNGIPFAAIGGAEVTFVDGSPVEGRSSYAVQASETEEGPFSPQSFPCEVTVGMGGVIRWVPFAGTAIYDLAVEPAQGRLFATDPIGAGGSGRIFLYGADLELLGEIPSPFERPGSIAFVPEIRFESGDGGGQDVVIRDVLAVAQTDGSLLSLVDLEGNSKTTFPLELGVEGGKVGGLAYLPGSQQFACLETTTHEVVVVSKYGRRVASCKPPDIFFLPDMDMGLTHDPVRDTYLATFADGYVRELYTGACARGEFEFPLEATGEGFAEPGSVGGIQIFSNTLFVARRDANAIFQTLLFPFTPEFLRGDFDRNGAVDLTDAVLVARYLFQAGDAPSCDDAADANDDAVLDISDPVFLLFFLFLQGPPPPAPFPDPGIDPTFRDNLGCES